MEVVELKNLLAKESYIYYRRSYTCNAILQLPTGITNLPIEFVIETQPTGKKDIEITCKNSIEYPLLPILKKLKEFILKQETEGVLTI